MPKTYKIALIPGDGTGPEVLTEAVKALVDWAFNYPYCYCQVVTATDVTNPASRRLLEKLGAKLVLENEQSTSWEFVNERKNYSL